MDSLFIERIKSNKNKDKATVFGYIYTLNRVSDEVSYWVCEKRGICKARIHTSNDIIVKPDQVSEIEQSHTHAPSQDRIKMLKEYRKMKDLASVTEQSTRGILSSGIETMHPSTVNKLPQLESVKRTIRNYKSISIESCGNPTTPAEIVIPDKYKITLKGEPFLLYDSGFGDQQRIIVYGTRNFISCLSSCDNWYCDGTFSVVPDLFVQLYTIHAEKDGNIFPCIYALLPNKSEATYDKLFKKLLEIEPLLNPVTVMIDFERAAMNALEENFISVITGCFFHLSQNIFRQVQEQGLAIRYQEDNNFAINIKMLASLAFVPENDVLICFNVLMQQFPEEAITLAKYFEKTYIGRVLPDLSRRTPMFPIRIWNIYSRVNSRLARTNNNVEGWHNAFKSTVVSSHPSFCKLSLFLQREQSLQEAVLAKWEAGETKKRSKHSIARDARILALVADYESRDTLSYLKGIAYNFEF